MNHKLTFTTQQLIIMRESMHAVTLKGSDAWMLGGILDKIYREIEKAIKEEEQMKVSEPPINNSPADSSN